MKVGWKTTEFWATVALNVGVVATALAGSLPVKWATIASSVSVVAYALARSLVKAAQPVPVTTDSSDVVTPAA